MTTNSIALGLALASLSTTAAVAQLETRNLTHNVGRGREAQIQQWLNYNEATCESFGTANITMTASPKLGTVRWQNSNVSPRTGPCAGRQFTVVFVYYKSTGAAGTDRFSFTVTGGRQILNNFTVTVR